MAFVKGYDEYQGLVAVIYNYTRSGTGSFALSNLMPWMPKSRYEADWNNCNRIELAQYVVEEMIKV